VADAEVIALAVRGLDAAGLHHYQIDVGHAGFFLGLLDGLMVGAEVKSAIHQALAARDVVELEQILESTPLGSRDQELLTRFPALRGGREILDAAASLVSTERAHRALEELATVFQLLGEHGLGEALSLDLGAIRDFTYYTGVIFEAYGPDLGRPVAQGGRYDNLLARFGVDEAATGFVMNLDVVGEALRVEGRQVSNAGADVAIAWGQAGLEPAIRLAQTLRSVGVRTVTGTESSDWDAAQAWGLRLEVPRLVFVNSADDICWQRGNEVVYRSTISSVATELVQALEAGRT
jgi:ATP phosphoribosyltransferase regulatory subunit